LINEKSFKCFGVRAVFVKPFFNAHPTAPVAVVAVNRIRRIVIALGVDLLNPALWLCRAFKLNNLPSSGPFDKVPEGFVSLADLGISFKSDT